MSDDAGSLISALARCQAKFKPIVKGHDNPAFRGSKYADVADVLEAVRPVLAAEGIVITQSTRVGEEGGVTLVTTLTCAFDDFEMTSEFPLYVAGQTAQQVGSLITYHKRYQACAILGVHPVGDDDDGNLAATAAPARPTQASAAVPDDWETRPLATMTFSELRGVAEKVGHSFSGGSKSELIRQLEPLVRAMSGAEPFDLPGDTLGLSTSAPPTDDDRPPFEPVVASAADDSGTERARRAAIRRGEQQ